jgi:hypothetical protein
MQCDILLVVTAFYMHNRLVFWSSELHCLLTNFIRNEHYKIAFLQRTWIILN